LLPAARHDGTHPPGAAGQGRGDPRTAARPVRGGPGGFPHSGAGPRGLQSAQQGPAAPGGADRGHQGPGAPDDGLSPGGDRSADFGWVNERMLRTRLGRTALQVSRLCLGTLNLGVNTSKEDSFRLLDRALDEGINYVDTANHYGWQVHRGMTEELLG